MKHQIGIKNTHFRYLTVIYGVSCIAYRNCYKRYTDEQGNAFILESTKQCLQNYITVGDGKARRVTPKGLVEETKKVSCMGFHLLFVLKKRMFVLGETREMFVYKENSRNRTDSRENSEMLRWEIHSTMDVVFSKWG